MILIPKKVQNLKKNQHPGNKMETITHNLKNFMNFSSHKRRLPYNKD